MAVAVTAAIVAAIAGAAKIPVPKLVPQPPFNESKEGIYSYLGTLFATEVLAVVVAAPFSLIPQAACSASHSPQWCPSATLVELSKV